MNATPRVCAVRDDALGEHDAVGLVEAVHTRQVTAAELVAAAIDRARSVDPALHAVVAWAADPTPAAGPFAGVPTFIKDNEAVAGLPSRSGSRATSARPVAQSSAFVERWHDLGLSILGTSAMPEFGLTASTEPLLSGPTRNPWDLTRSPGGSSGGSAALVAAGAVPIAHANDGGGSIRIPASCCGLVGLKPSRGRLLLPEGHERLPVAIATQGLLTRSVRDTARFYGEAERRAPAGSALPPVGEVVGASRRRLRIAFASEGLPGLPVDPDVQAAVVGAARLLDAMGHHVEQVAYPFGEQLGRDFLRYWAALAFAVQFGGTPVHGPDFDARQLEPFTLGMSRFLRSVAPRMPASILRLRRFVDEYPIALGKADVLLTPVTSQVAPIIGFLAPDLDLTTHLVRLLRYASFTMVQNVSGAPAISLPLGTSTDGLPIGVQAAARRGDDAMLIELAFELEAAAA